MSTIHLTGRLDPRSGWDARGCSIVKALDVVSTRSALILLREAFYGTARFDDFVTRAGASQAVTAARLRELVEAGLLVKRPYQEEGQRQRHEYLLTEKGEDFLPVLVAMMQWGDRWENDGGRVRLAHAGCGASIHAELRCENGHAVGDGEVELALRNR